VYGLQAGLWEVVRCPLQIISGHHKAVWLMQIGRGENIFARRDATEVLRFRAKGVKEGALNGSRLPLKNGFWEKPGGGSDRHTIGYFVRRSRYLSKREITRYQQKYQQSNSVRHAIIGEYERAQVNIGERAHPALSFALDEFYPGECLRRLPLSVLF
jgi:hypothetical protein